MLCRGRTELASGRVGAKVQLWAWQIAKGGDGGADTTETRRVGKHAGWAPRQKPGGVGITRDQAGLSGWLPGPESGVEGSRAEPFISQAAPTSGREITAGREEVRKNGCCG